jgi:predicted Zn-dependent peptidase
MLNLVFREFYSERDVVMEERRQMNESQPGGKLFESFMATAFIAHPYRRPIVGWGSNIKFLSKEATERFFKAYYAPNNAVVAIVGDIDPQELLGSIKKHFERVPSHKLPPPLSIKEPEQKGERKIKVNYDAKPRLIIGYHKPTLPEHDDYVFDVIDGLLSSGRTSRLYRRLVEREKIALSVSTANGLPGARYPNLFVIFAKPRHPHTLSELEEAIYREIKLLKEEPVEEKELQKIKNRLKADFVRNLNSNEGLASQLSYYQAVAGDWRYMEEQLNIIEKIIPEEIMKVAKKYLIADNRTVAELIKNED